MIGGKAFWLGFILLATCSVSAKAQLLPVRSELNVNGWNVPNVKGLKVNAASERYFDGGILRKRSFDITKRKPSILLSKKPESEKYCEFRRLQAYSFNDKIFAVEGGCVVFLVSFYQSKKATITAKSYMAAYTRYIFYDEDGDGRFERRYDSSDEKLEILVPAWAKE